MTKHDANRRERIATYLAGKPDATVREIMAHVGLASTSAVAHHLDAMERSGEIKWAECKACGHRIRKVA